MKKILFDSGCDLMGLQYVPEGVVFSKVPLKIIVGDKEFVDDATLDTEKMMDEVYAYPGKTGTACPSPEQWATEFRDAEECYVITVTGTLSGSHNSAELAKRMVLEEHPEKKIYILDSCSASGKMALLVYKLVELLEKGLEFEEVCREMDAYAKDTQLVFLLYSIENLVKNGRVSKMAGMAANVLGLHVIAKTNEGGSIESIGKARGKKKGAKILLDEMERQSYKGGKIILSHCGNEEGLQFIKECILEIYPGVEIEEMKTGGICSYYAERGGVVVGYECR